jgi:predicted transcriptional regulator
MIVEERNSVMEMVSVLKRIGPMNENEINKAAFGYDRNRSSSSNKKYADMLRRGMKKGLIDRISWPSNAIYHGRAKFIYFATRQVECSSNLDMEMANESI